MFNVFADQYGEVTFFSVRRCKGGGCIRFIFIEAGNSVWFVYKYKFWRPLTKNCFFTCISLIIVSVEELAIPVVYFEGFKKLGF